jgi:VRR-NUC domain
MSNNANIRHSFTEMEGDSDDDSVEVLLTIFPASPKVKKILPNPPPSAHASPPSAFVRPTINSEDSLLDSSLACGTPFSPVSSAATQISPPVGTTPANNTTQKSKFSFRTSAYLQSLAEICHAILWDVRWRVGGPRLERLLQWERGEDLSAVFALARRYLPPVSTRSFSQKQPCQCIFCSEASGGSDKKTGIESTKRQSHGNEDRPNSPRGHSQGDDDGDDEYDRALNLYSRLYFRKGPWFRVDDIFKYYALKQSVDSPLSAATSTNTQETPALASPSKFFVPKSAKKRRLTAASPTRIESRYIDHDFIDKQLHSVSALLQDLKQLYGMGLIRSFDSEEECGKTIGEIQTYGLLKQEEQRIILAKLGGATKSPAGREPLVENKIWKQMCQQQSIMAPQLSSSSNTTVFLPVAKHLDQVLITSWANTMLLRASRVDYLPQGVFKKAIVPIQRRLHDLVKKSLGEIKSSEISLTCLRLREAPLLSLQRCCRLYICATTGPGEMRGDTGINGWKALPGEVDKPCERSSAKAFPAQAVSPPCAPNWHNTMYPGRDFRFKLISCAFREACVPLPVQDDIVQSLSDDELRRTQVFTSVDAFQLWELSVIIRSTVDYLMETNDLTLYDERKRAREREGAVEGAESFHEPPLPGSDVARNVQVTESSPMDFMKVLCPNGRREILLKFTSFITQQEDEVLDTTERVEVEVMALFCGECALKNDCERVLCVIGVIAANLLRLRNKILSNDVQRTAERPWLRHLWWEGCLVYLLWDIVPILEQRGYYQQATMALEVLLFGKELPRNAQCKTIPRTLIGDEHMFLAQAYLSRRARGKAFDRLVIDYLHILRQQRSALPNRDKKPKGKSGNFENFDKTHTPNDLIARLCGDLLQVSAPSGQISFSAARTLARRLKQPLSVSLGGLELYEVSELGHRYANSSSDVPPATKSKISEGAKRAKAVIDCKKYSDWSPATDTAVANAMLADARHAVGGRCSYISFEDREVGNFRSLNVEELALEYYNTGRLPEHQDPNTVRGGWVGWHDEGGRLRTLFRILASFVVLGSDWGCKALALDRVELATIHLTPYQGAPFDLHVGAEQRGPRDISRRGFYERRRKAIDIFLSRLFEMAPEEVAELVHRSILTRWKHAQETGHIDPVLAQDVQQTRTLCAAAAGFGGKMLAALCRCLFFDYRHYSGGLPDLTLIRAIFERDGSCSEESLVDLGAWIGEGFSPDVLAERDGKSAVRMLEDQDEEFLGCSKVGDSGRRNARGSRSAGTRTFGTSVNTATDDMVPMPEALQFQHEGRRIRVECMLVEVKSQNDRLDARQEDWLNILDRHGTVRVCKFGAQKKATSNKSKATPITNDCQEIGTANKTPCMAS